MKIPKDTNTEKKSKKKKDDRKDSLMVNGDE